APNRPSPSTSHPACDSTWCRAEARAVRLATVAPVVKPAAVPSGTPNTSTTQPRDTSSRVAVAGATDLKAVFWSHAPASQFAASAGGNAPPADEAEDPRPGHRRGGRGSRLVQNPKDHCRVGRRV